MPKISVIVPVYNAEKYLHRCVDSILTQTFTDFELLLINDGSKDKSGAICDEYAAKDSRVRVFHKENGGVSSARNLGLDNAKGEWITFVDSDDWIVSDMYEKMLQKLVKNNADLCLCDINMYWGDEVADLVYEHCLSVVNEKDKDVEMFINSSWHSCCNIMAKKDLFDVYELRSPNGIAYCEDFHLSVRLLFYASRVVKVNEPLYVYDRTNESSAVHCLNEKKQADRCWCDMDIISFFRKHGVYNKYERAMSHRVLAYTQEWVLHKSMWDEFLNYFPESFIYISSCKKIIPWRKILMKCIIKKYWCFASLLLLLKNLSKKIRNA